MSEMYEQLGAQRLHARAMCKMCAEKKMDAGEGEQMVKVWVEAWVEV